MALPTPTPQEIFTYDSDAYSAFLDSCRTNPDLNFFQRAYVCPRALLAMVKHSLTTNCEIMGILSGQATSNRLFLITNAVPFNVIGTETRVGATDDCWVDWFDYKGVVGALGHDESSCGWYHSHPSYMPYMSEIDVATHRQNQAAYHAYVALVVDPISTVVTGKVQLGAYITYPPDSKRDSEVPPPDLIQKYGSAAYKYYELELMYYRTPLDTVVLSDIITKSYGQAISCSPLRLNANFVGEKVMEAGLKLKRLATADERPEDLDSLVKTVQRINNDRKTGLWVERMKRAAFG
jgi:COP9 signalosome complex subunit 5